MCSSYDYDAPISEAGWATEKYFLLRDLLKGYLPAGQSLPTIPEALPVMEIPEIKFTQVASLFSNLPVAKQAIDIQPMEQFDQGWGSILYRTVLPQDVKAGTVLEITEVHDWAQVFVNNTLLARLDRRKGEFTVTLPALKKGTQLDILVEAMGRVNFDKSIHDRKGITESVVLAATDGNKQIVKNWQVYNLPVDYAFASNKQYVSGGKQTMPAYYKATFKLSKTDDTFLDMSTWGKGMVWVNGHAMGRFWEIGPQQTLFMPGCWLKKGVNEIIVLDLKGPKEATIVGLDKPILDMLRVAVPETHRKQGQTIKLEKETPVAAGTRENWKIVYADSEETRSGNRTADKIYDLQESTFWQTVDNTAYPHQVVIDLGKEYNVTGFRILPRAEQGAPGMIKDYKVYVKTTGFGY